MFFKRAPFQRKLICFVVCTLFFTPRSVHGQSPFSDPHKLCEASFSAPLSSGILDLPIYSLHKSAGANAWRESPGFLYAAVETRTIGEAKSIGCVKESQMRVGVYTDGAAAYRVTWTIRLILWPSGKIVSAQTFSGAPPPRVKTTRGAGRGYPSTESVQRWFVSKLKNTASFMFTSNSGHDLKYSADGKYLLAQTFSNTLQNSRIVIFETTTGRALSTVENGGSLHTMALSPDGKLLAMKNTREQVQLWATVTGQLVRSLPLATDKERNIRSIAFSPDGRTLIASERGSRDKETTLIFWEVATGKTLNTLTTESCGCPIFYSPDGNTLASGNFDSVDLLDAATAKKRGGFQGMSVGGLAFSPDGRLFAIGESPSRISAPAFVTIWDVTTSKQLHKLSVNKLRVVHLAFSPDGTRLAAADTSAEGKVLVWEVTTGNLQHTFTGHIYGVHTVAFSPDGMKLASGGADKTIRIWDLSAAP